MKPAVVMPMHDPNGLLFPHLKVITGRLKTLFERAFISVPASTYQAQQEHVAWAEADPFFEVLHFAGQKPVGHEFADLFRHAAYTCPPQQIIHLCFIDRVAFVLQTDYADQFCTDVQSLTASNTPLCFHRSPNAWETHPRNYRELEEMATRTGELLFGKRLDYGWCHLVVQASDLTQIMPHVHNPGIAMMAEMILLLKDELQIVEVDWLAWEDPFIEQTDAATLKTQKEQSISEVQKRLSYIIPALQLIADTKDNR